MSEYLDSSYWADHRPSDTQPTANVPPPTSGSPKARSGLLRFGAVVIAVALAAGGVGYLFGNHEGTNPAVRFPGGIAGRFPNPFNFGSGSGGSSPFFPGGFQFPNPIASSASVPAAVERSESALVDVDTTVDGGGGAGTGIVLTSDGLVLTNNHVIDSATSISVTDVGSGKTYSATVVGYDLKDDVAVIKLSGASGLTVAKLASSPATVGEKVYAVGNAGGTGGTPTVTSGAITELGQSLTASDDLTGSSETLHGMLVTDATLISGDSGGALTASNGDVVGVDTAASNSDSSAQGFAVPIAKALKIADEIIAGTASSRIHIGPTALLGVFISSSQSGGVGATVNRVENDSPAASAGIVAHSLITSVGGQPVTSSASLRDVMTTLQPGQTVRVSWTDPSGKHHAASVTLTSGAPQ